MELNEEGLPHNEQSLGQRADCLVNCEQRYTIGMVVTVNCHQRPVCKTKHVMSADRTQ